MQQFEEAVSWEHGFVLFMVMAPGVSAPSQGRLSRAPSFPTTTSRSSCRLSPDPTHCKDLTKFSMKSTPAKRDKWI